MKLRANRFKSPVMQIGLLALIAGMGPYSASAYVTAYPAVAASLGVSVQTIQHTLTIYLFFFAASSLFAGAIADAIGRKRALILFTLVFLAGSIICAATPVYAGLMLGRALQGIGVSVGGIVAQASIRDRFTGAEADRYTALMTAMFAISPGISPLLGVLITSVASWRAIFLSLALYALVSLALTARFFVDPLPPGERRPFSLRELAGDWIRGLERPRFFGGVLAHAGSFMGAVLYLAAVTNLAFNVLHVDVKFFVLETIPLMAVSTLGAFTAHMLTNRWSPDRTIATGMGVMCLGALVGAVSLFSSHPLEGLLAAPMLYQVGMSMVSPLMMNANIGDFPRHHAIAASLQQTFCTAAFAFCSATWVPVTQMDAGAYVAVMVGAALTGASLWTYGELRRRPA